MKFDVSWGIFPSLVPGQASHFCSPFSLILLWLFSWFCVSVDNTALIEPCQKHHVGKFTAYPSGAACDSPPVLVASSGGCYWHHGVQATVAEEGEEPVKGGLRKTPGAGKCPSRAQHLAGVNGQRCDNWSIVWVSSD